jgi:hypothetical protein
MIMTASITIVIFIVFIINLPLAHIFHPAPMPVDLFSLNLFSFALRYFLPPYGFCPHSP